MVKQFKSNHLDTALLIEDLKGLKTETLDLSAERLCKMIDIVLEARKHP